jgi:hypothetical protein
MTKSKPQINNKLRTQILTDLKFAFDFYFLLNVPAYRAGRFGSCYFIFAISLFNPLPDLRARFIQNFCQFTSIIHTVFKCLRHFYCISRASHNA